MTKSILGLLSWSLPFLLIAQSNTTTQSMVTKEGPAATGGKGIHWTTGLSWEQIKQKAKAENKYIFLDIFTTWCGPCKMLDKTVFTNDTVGDFFNQHFISVKVQMDRTKNDNAYIKSWYETADAMSKEYMIEGYPTAVFLSPDAKIVHKDGGFRPVQDFIEMASLALTPGKVYDDPYLKYQNLVSEYKQGVKHYDRMAEMIKIAFQLNEADFARALFKDHLSYASTLNEKERYTKENIEVWSSFILKPGSKALGFFLKDEDKIDKVMDQKGYSRDIVDKNIQSTIVDTFYRMQKGETTTITGDKISNSKIMFKQLPVSLDGKTEPDYVEADWKMLESMIRKYFNKEYSERNVLMARMRWYQQHQNIAGASKVYFDRLDKWPPSYPDVRSQNQTNEFAWYSFLHDNDKKILNRSAIQMEKLIQQLPESHERHELLDTYANLLYKLGRTEEAIQWEEKALSITNPNTYDDKVKVYKDVMEKMKKGEPTYLEQGAIWIKEKF
jgi:thioredoxin-related protein